MAAWHFHVVSPVPAELRHYDEYNYKDLSSVEEWIKHYCQRKAGKLPLENGSAYRRKIGGCFQKFYLLAHLRLACSTYVFLHS